MATMILQMSLDEHLVSPALRTNSRRERPRAEADGTSAHKENLRCGERHVGGCLGAWALKLFALLDVIDEVGKVLLE